MALPALLLAAVATWKVDAGTEAALAEDHRAPVVSFAVVLPVGTWSPWGRAHGAELAFSLLDRDPGRKLLARADALAVELDLTMTRRAATLRASCLKRDLEGTIALLHDVLSNRSTDRRDLERARREESILWRSNATDVDFRLRETAAEAIFRNGDPRRWPFEKPKTPSLGADDVGRIRDALVGVPGRIVGLAGDLTPAEAREVASRLLPKASTDAPDDVAPMVPPVVPAAERPRDRSVSVKKLTQVYLGQLRDSLPWDDPRRPAFLVANHVLTGHFYARLYTALRHESGDTYGVRAIETGDTVPGMYGAATYTRTANAAAIEAKLAEAMRIFHDKGITETERAEAIGFLDGHRAFQRQSADQVLDRWLRERVAGLPEGTLDKQIEEAGRLSLEAINAFIAEFYDPAQFSTVRVRPE